MQACLVLLIATLVLATPLRAFGADEILGGLVKFETGSDAIPSPPPLDMGPAGYGFSAQPLASPGAFEAGADPHFHYHGPEILFHQSHPDEPGRHIGRGSPLQGTSWLNRPIHAGWFVGGLIGDELIDGRVDQTDDLFGGYRLGWDWDHYWGSEVRVAFARPDLADDLSDEQTRISRNWFLDAHLAYYPWGDAQWRPYFSAGMGIATFRFIDEQRVDHENTLLHMPLGMGVKYLADRWLALRMEVVDNIAFGAGDIDSMHNVTYTFGVEARFGPGTSRKYYPY